MKALLVAALLAIAAPVAAEPISLPVRVMDGSTWTIESRRVREDQRKDGSRTVQSTSRYRVDFRETAEGGRLTLTPLGGSIFGDLPAGVDLDGFNFPLELEVDESLTPVRLGNWPEVRAAVYKMISGLEPKVVEGMRSLFDRIGDEQAASMFFPQVAFLGLGQGLSLEPGEPLTYDDNLANPLGGPPIKAVGAFTLDDRDDAQKQTTVVWTQTLDRDSMLASMKVTMQVLMERLASSGDAAKMEAQMKDMSIARDSRCRFIIDDASGVARQADCSATIDVKGPGEAARRTDAWTITQTLPEKR